MEEPITVPSIEQSVELDGELAHVKYRYYKHYYHVPKKQNIRNESELVSSSENTDSNEESGQRNKRIKLDDDINEAIQNSSAMNSSSKESAETDSNSMKIEEKSDENNKMETENDSNMEVSSQEETKLTVTGLETLVMVHSNKLCVVSLSPFHPIIKQNKEVTKIEYDVFGVDRMSNKVLGKGKRGGQVMGSKATICRLHTEDGSKYDVPCGACGKLLQVNERLVANPDLVRTNWGSEGFLGVVMPRLKDFEPLVSRLTPVEVYEKAYQDQIESSQSL